MLLVEGECRQNLQAADLLARQSGRTLQIYQCSRFVKRYSRLFWISADHRLNIHLESVLVRDLHALQHALVPRLVPLHPDVTVLPILAKIFQLAQQCSGSVRAVSVWATRIHESEVRIRIQIIKQKKLKKTLISTLL